MSDLNPIGDLLIRYSARTEPADAMVFQLREIHQQFERDRDAESGYLRMGFLCAKAIERCHMLEEEARHGPASGRAGDRASDAGRGVRPPAPGI
jgi:hypothetical protein